MAEKPDRASAYSSGQTELVRATCLYVATKLGDLMDELVVVGGLVPSLLIDPAALPEETPLHVGTLDLDVGLALALLDEGRYRTVSERLRDAGFTQDESDKGHPTRQRWRITKGDDIVTVDFLIPPSRDSDKGGTLRDIEKDFAAIISPGLKLAFVDQRRIRIDAKTIFGENASREVSVCGPGAFVIIKALAFENRGKNKDAYDLYYLVRNYGEGVEDVAASLRPLLEEAEAQQAMDVLRRNFLDHNGTGPRRVADFLLGRPDDEVQADVVSFVKRLLDLCESPH